MSAISTSYNHEDARDEDDGDASPGRHASAGGDVEGLRELRSVGLLEYLDVDDRPVLVFDLASLTKGIPTYFNASLRDIPQLEAKMGGNALGTTGDVEYLSFMNWASLAQQDGQRHTAYLGQSWSARTIRNRWRIVSGGNDHRDGEIHGIQSEAPRLKRAQTAIPASDSHPVKYPAKLRKESSEDEGLEAQIAALRLRDGNDYRSHFATQAIVSQDTPDSHALARLDIIRSYPSVVPESEHLKVFLEFDWSSTKLGAIGSWSTSLVRMVNFLMNDQRPAAMYWGNDRTMMYNEAYAHVTGQKHPGMMGKTFSEAWAEIEGFDAAFETARQTGVSFVVDDAMFEIDRYGYLEETYISLTLLPFLVDDDEISFYNPVSDTTRQVIADRRMAFLLRLGQVTSQSKDPVDLWQRVLRSLRTNHPDLPFAVLYSVTTNTSDRVSKDSDTSSSRTWELQGTVRIPDTCSSIPDRVTEKAMGDFLPTFAELVNADSSVLLSNTEGSLPVFVSRDGCSVSGDERSSVFLPIRSVSHQLLGFLLLGINAKKRFDDDYKVFIELINRQLTSSLASAELFREEIDSAALDRKLLTKKLALQTLEASEIETRFRRMADLAPVGMFHMGTDGIMIYCNENYYEITGYPRGPFYQMAWLDVLADDDLPLMDGEWAKLLSGQSVSFEIRLRRSFVAEELFDGEEVKGEAWILAAAYGERNDDGTITAILGCLTDISRQKWMEGFQKRKMIEAVELKRQQENFIDMTSHEMRNPLSAIVQCADWISTSLSSYAGDTNNIVFPREVIDGYADATETIVLCAHHQKRIIDDVLTLSKLDSDLLSISPVEVQPAASIRASLKMFEFEVQKSDIDLKFLIDSSYTELAVEWVRLDPSRLVQILINLLTNAIKFTMSETRRKITITVGASLKVPTTDNIDYLPREPNRRDLTRGSSWGLGESIYLCITVQDSGCGLDEKERNTLFKRFSQASPRTHVQYGGSGLGLFICRQLTELQGGQIGVTSTAGEGSTFAFYVRARRCPAPACPPGSDDGMVYDRPRTASLDRVDDRSSNPDTDSSPQPRHVLVVEDNIVNQKVLSKQLRSAGCIVSVANHGAEALAFLETTHFWRDHSPSHLQPDSESHPIPLSVILMDLEMPVMDGLTCVRLIRKFQSEGKVVGHVPVIAVTANARSEQISVAREAGMDSVVTKPFRIPDLLPEIDRQVRRGRGRRVANL